MHWITVKTITNKSFGAAGYDFKVLERVRDRHKNERTCRCRLLKQRGRHGVDFRYNNDTLGITFVVFCLLGQYFWAFTYYFVGSRLSFALLRLL